MTVLRPHSKFTELYRLLHSLPHAVSTAACPQAEAPLAQPGPVSRADAETRLHVHVNGCRSRLVKQEVS